MSYARLEELGGIQWPCPARTASSRRTCTAGSWADDPAERGKPAAFSVVLHELPVDELNDDFPIRLTTGRRLDSYNTGVQSRPHRVAAAHAARPSTSRPKTPARSAVAKPDSRSG